MCMFLYWDNLAYAELHTPVARLLFVPESGWVTATEHCNMQHCRHAVPKFNEVVYALVYKHSA